MERFKVLVMDKDEDMRRFHRVMETESEVCHTALDMFQKALRQERAKVVILDTLLANGFLSKEF